jgi:ADP-ribosylglycohydrolase
MDIATQDRFLGCMYGLAIGDALGYPIEFLKLEEIRKILGPQGVIGFNSLKHPLIARMIGQLVGSYSDDTQMTLATANALLKSKTDKIEDIMEEIKKEYISWMRSPDNNRAPGLTCLAGITNLEKGIHWTESGINREGCGAAMRVAPIGLYFNQDIHRVLKTTGIISECTHKNDSARDSAIALAYGISDILRYANLDEPNSQFKPIKILEDIQTIELDEKVKNKLAQVKKVLEYPNTDKALNELGEGWIGREAVASSFYCFLKHPYDFKKAVLLATNTNGDSDSIASITGAISGAYNGINAIPADWIEQIENRKLLEQTARRLYQKSKLRNS